MEEVLSNPEIPVGPGYAESKWIAERILDAAAERTALRPVVVRLGQVCGEGNGTWNEKEWFPSLIKSALTLGCLPSLDGVSGILVKLMMLSLIGHLDCRLDSGPGCCRGNGRDVARRFHPGRTHLPHSPPTRRALQLPHFLRRILAQRSTCSIYRVAFQTFRGAQGPVLFRCKPGKGTSEKPRIAVVQFLPICALRTRVGAPRRCALRYGARSTRIEGVGRRRQATRGRECTEMAERMALERLPPSRTEEDNSP